MPTNVQTIYGNSVKASPYDAINEGAANRAQQRSLASEEMQARLQDAAANRALQLQMGGSYSDRSANDASQAGLERTGRMDIARMNDTGQTTRANIANQPEFGRQGMQMQQYNDMRADGATMRGVESDLYSRIGAGFGAPAAGGPVTPGAIFADQGAGAATPANAEHPLDVGLRRFTALQTRNIIEDPVAKSARERKDKRQDAEFDRDSRMLEKAMDKATDNGDWETVTALQALGKQVGASTPGDGAGPVTGNQAFRKAFDLNAQQKNANQNTAGAAAALDFNFNQGLQEINRLASDVVNRKTDSSAVIAKASEMRDLLVRDYKMTDERARDLIGKELDKTLPGLGTDIVSTLENFSVPVATLGLGTLLPGSPRPGAATGTRQGLRGAGFLPR